MIYGVQSSRKIQKGEGSDRPFSHIKEQIVLNIKEGTLN